MPSTTRRSLSWRWHGRGSSTTTPAGAEGQVFALNADLVPEWQAPSGGGPAAQIDANGTTLNIDAIADGQTLVRSGSSIIGSSAGGSGLTDPHIMARVAFGW